VLKGGEENWELIGKVASKKKKASNLVEKKPLKGEAAEKGESHPARKKTAIAQRERGAWLNRGGFVKGNDAGGQ